jgi:phospholipid/cholesterol/gamma-HCH transport system substrate-binding protein
MVKNLHEVTQGLPASLKRVDALVTELSSTSQQVRTLAASLHDTSVDAGPRLKQLTERLNATAANLARASAGIDRFVDDNRTSLTGFAQQGLPQLQRTLEEARAAAESFGELSRSLKNDPSQLIYQPVRRGVEIPR